MMYTGEIVFYVCILWSFRNGKCADCNVDEITVQTNFNITMFLGRWYQIKWLPQYYIPPEKLYQDYQHVYTKTDGGNITVTGMGRDPAKISVCFQYSAELFPTATPGKFLYRRKKSPTEYITSAFWIIKTDYYNYAVAYGCREKNITSSTCVKADSWVLSRHQSISPQNLTDVELEIANLCVNGTALADIKQTRDCSVTSSFRRHGEISVFLVMYIALLHIIR